MTLSLLLWRAGISRYEQGVWFWHCRLEKTVILCEDPDLVESLRRCWLPQIQQVMPECQIRYERAKPIVMKAAYRGAPVASQAKLL